MKVGATIKKFCEHCQIVKRGKRVYVLCKINPRHKQRQKGGKFSTLNTPLEQMLPQQQQQQQQTQNLTFLQKTANLSLYFASIRVPSTYTFKTTNFVTSLKNY